MNVTLSKSGILGAARRSVLPVSPCKNRASVSMIHGSRPEERHGQPLSQTALPQVQPKVPLLLLEGDSYHVSSDGFARTLYEAPSLNQSRCMGATLEEAYDIDGGRKTFTIQWKGRNEAAMDGSGMFDPFLNTTVEIKEINNGMSLGAGTGSATWESSLCMTLFFAANPELLRGDVIELGSGVGLGGILCSVCSTLHQRRNAAKSITLTDFNLQVLQQCRANVVKASDSHNLGDINILSLDWFESLKNSKPLDGKTFDTIIASDCIYRSSDIIPFLSTGRALLKDGNSRLHLFGPPTRGALQELVEKLRRSSTFCLEVDEVVLHRHRLPRGLASFAAARDMHFHAPSTPTFLHLALSLRSPLD